MYLCELCGKPCGLVITPDDKNPRYFSSDCCEADYHHVKDNHHSVLFQAIESGRISETLKAIHGHPLLRQMEGR